MLKRKSSVILFSSLAISGILLSQMGLYIISMFTGWSMKFNLVEVCHSGLKTLGLTSLEYILDGLIIYTFIYGLWKIGIQFFQTARMNRRFKLYKERKLSLEINQYYQESVEEIMVLSYPAPFAITMGFVRSKIVLTTGLINLLTNDELDAVIVHEAYHNKNRDPLKIFLLTLSASVLWYIPIQKWFMKTYGMLQEVLADEHAIEQQDTATNLGSALLKMLKVGKQKNMPFVCVSFADTSVNYRIEYILNPVKNIPLDIPLNVLCISSVIFSLICGLFLYVLA